MDYVTRELLDHGTLGQLIRYINVPKHLSQSQLLLSYIEEYIISDNSVKFANYLTSDVLKL